MSQIFRIVLVALDQYAEKNSSVKTLHLCLLPSMISKR